MTSPDPTIVWTRSDSLLSGAAITVRGVGLTQGEHLRSAVGVTVQVDVTACQVSEAGVVTATLLVSPDEALGISRWLREAAQAVDEVGPPLLEW